MSWQKLNHPEPGENSAVELEKLQKTCIILAMSTTFSRDDTSGAQLRKPRLVGACFVLIILWLGIFLLYGQSISYNFIYDDHAHIIAAKTSSGMAAFIKPFFEPHLENGLYYRPLSRVTYLFQKSIHGENPAWFHILNIIFLGITASALLCLYRNLFPDQDLTAAAWAVAFFAFHPVASSCVYVISGREAMLAVLAIATVLICFSSRKTSLRWLGVFLFLPALFVRENVMVLLAIVFLADNFSEKNGNFVSRKILWLQYLLMSGSAIFFLVLHQHFTTGSMSFAPVMKTVLAIIRSYLFAFQAILLPWWNLFYEPSFSTWFSWEATLGVLVILSVWAWFARSFPTLHRKQIAFWALWCLMGFLPTANLFSQETPFDERHVLIILSGMAGVLGVCVSRWRLSCHWRTIRVILLILIVVFAGISVNRGFFFQSNEIFVARWLQTNPNSAVACALMGEILEANQRPEEAMDFYNRSLKLIPNFPDALNRRAILRIEQGKLNEAHADLTNALLKRPSAPKIRFNLITLDLDLQNPIQAMQHLSDGFIWKNFAEAPFWNQLVARLTQATAYRTIISGLPLNL